MPRKKADSKTAVKTVKKATTRKKSSVKAAEPSKTKAAAKPAAKVATKTAAKTAVKTTARTTAKTTPKATPKTAAKTTAKTAAKSPAKAAAKSTAKSPAKAAKASARPGRKTRTKSSALKTTEVAAKPEVASTEAVASDNTPATEPLTGKELLKKVKELGNSVPKEEKAKICGYSALTKNGLERVNMMKFLNALIDAGGIDLDGKSGDSSGRGGRSASYKITVQSNGNLLIGAAYTKQMDLKPGDEFKITLGRKHIRLTQVEDE